MAATTYVAIYGSGVLARQLIRRIFDNANLNGTAVIVYIAESADRFSNVDAFGNQLALNLEFDSIYGRWHMGNIQYNDNSSEIIIEGRSIPVDIVSDISNLDLARYGVDVCIDCSGIPDDGSFYNGVYNAGGKCALTTTLPTVSGFSYYGKAVVTKINPQSHGVPAYMGDAELIAKSIIDKVLNDAFGINNMLHTVHMSESNFGYVQDYPDGNANESGRACDNLICMGCSNDASTRLGYIIPELQGKTYSVVYRINTKNVNNIQFDCITNYDRTVLEIQAALKAAEGTYKYLYTEKPIVSLDCSNYDNIMILGNHISVFSSNAHRYQVECFYDAIILQVNNIIEYLELHPADWSY